MRRVTRYALRVVTVLAALLVVAILALAIFVHTDTGRSMVRDRVLAQLATTFEGEVAIGRLEGSPFGTLVVHDIAIADAHGHPTIAIDRIALSISLTSLLRERLSFSNVVADGVTLVVEREPDGTWSLEHLLRPGPESAWTIVVDDVALRGRLAVVTDGEPIHVDDLGIAGTLRTSADSIATSVVARGMWRERAAPLQIIGSLDRRGDALAIPSIAIHTGDASLHAARVHYDGASFSGVGFVRAPRTDVARLARVDSLADASLAFRTYAPGDLDLADVGSEGRATIAKPVDTGAPAKPDDTPAHSRDTTSAPANSRGATRVVLAGAHGEARVRGMLDVWLARRRIAGSLVPSNVDAGMWSHERVPVVADGKVTIDATFGGQVPVGRVLIDAVARATGAHRDAPAMRVAANVSSDGNRVRATVDAHNAAVAATASGELAIDGERVGLDMLRLAVSATDLERATAGLVPARGRIDLSASANGPLLPHPELAVTGRIDGRAVRAQDFGAASLAATFDARRLPSRPLGRVDVVARGVDRRGSDFSLRELTLAAADRPDGAILVSLRGRPDRPGEPWRLDADAIVRIGDVVTVDLQHHAIGIGAPGVWSGTSGRIAIGRDRVELRDFHTENGDSTIALGGEYRRGNGDFAARATVEALALEHVDASIAGRVDARVDLERRAGRVMGDATFAGAGIGGAGWNAAERADARGTARFDERGIAGDITIDARGAGTAKLRVDIDAPRRFGDVRAWRRLDRSAIRTAQLDVVRLRIGQLLHDEAYGGTIDGHVRIDAGEPSGQIELRKVRAPQLRGIGAIDGELAIVRPTSTGPIDDLEDDDGAGWGIAFVPDPRHGVGVTLAARIDTIGRFDVKAELRVPDHVFDAREWRRLDRRLVRRATIGARDLAFDPARLRALGIESSARGRLSVDAEIVPDLATVKARIDELRGSSLAQPMTVDVGARIDETRATADVSIATAATRVLDAHAEMPVTVTQLLDDPGAVRAKPLRVTAKVDAPARPLLGVFGRTEVLGGWLVGTAEVSGTLAAPIATAELVGHHVQIPPGPGGKPIRVVRKLVARGEWKAGGGRLAVDATQDGGAMLQVRAEGELDRPREATLSVVAKKFDLVPILVFAPGPLSGAAGRLDANVSIRGTSIAGAAYLRDARVPIGAWVGTLRRAAIDLVVKGQRLELAIDGLLGGGTVKGTGTFGITNGTIDSQGKVALALRRVRPIGLLEPQIDADAQATVRRTEHRWQVNVAVKNGKIDVPSSRGEPLAPRGAPDDMVFVTPGERRAKDKTNAPPDEPLVLVNIAIGPTRIESEELRATVHGNLAVTTDTNDVGIVGKIESDRGEIDVFGRRYKADRALVQFDGSIDPLLDVALVHEFPDLVMTAKVSGRVSQPRVELASDPGTYSQGQLLGFLLGGEPTGGIQGGLTERAASTGASLLANRIGGYVRRSLPVDLDVLRYEAATATSSAAVTVGTWVSDDLFLAYRRRLETRPDENSGEGQVEWWLFRRVVVEGVVGDRGRHAIDLLWRKRY